MWPSHLEVPGPAASRSSSTSSGMIVIFFLGQRYFVEGIATTGRKG
jgi:hypothetical protein